MQANKKVKHSQEFRARLLVQEARQFGRRDKQNYLEWQDEVIQLLKKIGEVDNRNSEAVQKEKQKTLRIFKQSYPSPDVARVEKVKTTTVQNGLSESKVNVYSEVDPPIVKVSQLRNMYESKHWDEDPKPVPTYRETKYYSELHNSSKQSHELVKQQNFDDSEYTSSSRYSYSSSSGSDEDKQLYETHEGEIHEVEPPRERNVEESHIAKVRDLRSVFERDNYQPDEELLPTNTSSKLPVQIARMPVESAQKIEEREKPSDEEIPSTKLPTHIVTRPSKWFKKTEEDEEEEVPQEESSGVYRVDDDGFIVEPNDGTPRRVRDTLKDEQIVHSVTVKELKNVFEGNGPSQNPEVQTATMQIAHEQKYIPYEEYDNNMQQTVVITDLNNEENDEENPVDTSHIAKVKELKDAIEKNEDNSQNTTKVNQSQRRPYHSGPNVESLEHYTNDDIEIYHRGAHVNRSEHNIPDHRRRGKKSKYAHPEKETQEPPRRYREHNRAEKSTITRSKSLADLKRNRRPHGHEDESSRMYQRRHSNTEAHPKMFDFRETFSKFENLTTESQNGNIEREFQTVSSPRTRGRSTVDQEASDLREIDQIKSRARLLVQEARQFGRRDKQNYLEWQDEVIQLLKKIGEVDNRNSEAVQKEKQKTLRIFKQSYPSPDVARVEKVKTTTVQNGLSESKVNVYSEVDPPIVKVSQLRNMYESKHWDEDPKPVPTYRETKYYSELHNSSKQSHELVKQQNFDDSLQNGLKKLKKTKKKYHKKNLQEYIE
ncbi:uncharacterized protein LOC112905678 [Agrilus planipennis]|uniref:Uncharacterized protein LOC112905678 n=1 Tax=Agrilus planipennis TaxID=224129 RepID=A0A7F5REC4_AGRPL|nr:uncharacterized protein LOC112905678 [Agrilus planipennis]